MSQHEVYEELVLSCVAVWPSLQCVSLHHSRVQHRCVYRLCAFPGTSYPWCAQPPGAWPSGYMMQCCHALCFHHSGIGFTVFMLRTGQLHAAAACSQTVVADLWVALWASCVHL